MSRVIKFRAWDKGNFEMFTYDDIGDVVFGLENDGTVSLFICDSEESPDIDVMQFTGLTDKNGVDIYEGDILKFHHEWEGMPSKQVMFHDSFLMYTLLSKEEKEWVDKGSNHYKYWGTDGDNLYFLHEVENYECEVIGNIHENGDLL